MLKLEFTDSLLEFEEKKDCFVLTILKFFLVAGNDVLVRERHEEPKVAPEARCPAVQ